MNFHLELRNNAGEWTSNFDPIAPEFTEETFPSFFKAKDALDRILNGEYYREGGYNGYPVRIVDDKGTLYLQYHQPKVPAHRADLYIALGSYPDRSIDVILEVFQLTEEELLEIVLGWLSSEKYRIGFKEDKDDE